MFDWLLSHLIAWFYSFFGVIRALGESAIDTILTQVATHFPDSAGAMSSISTTLAQINFFCPLSETVTMSGAFLGLWAVVVAYKLVKSWIPTVSS